MSRCGYCKWGGGQHDSDCCYQVVLRDGEWATIFNAARKKLYDQGWIDGRQGKRPQQDDPTYRLGFREGECALEEYENGYDPVWMS